jgi:hypothetical protein
MGPKAMSVTESGEDDGFVPEPGWMVEMTPDGETRLVVSVPVGDLARVHAALATALAPPISVLYRQKIDRAEKRPHDAPARDHVAVGLPLDRVMDALQAAAPLVYHDARGEFWLRGKRGEQLILDQDGLMFCYPDDPAFREALAEAGVPGRDVTTIADRDYVKHWFHAEADASEAQLLATLHLTEYRPR